MEIVKTARGRALELVSLWHRVDQAKLEVQAAIITELYKERLWIGHFNSFGAFIKAYFGITEKYAQDQMKYLVVAKNLGLAQVSEISENGSAIPEPLRGAKGERRQYTQRWLQPLTKYNNMPDFQRLIWSSVINKEDTITRDIVYNHVRLAEEQRDIDFVKTYFVEDWEKLDGDKQSNLMSIDNPKTKFNKTNDMVDWAMWTWNPVTGCLHDCDYCYARDIAMRFYENFELEDRFKPVFYPGRLSAPANTSLPDINKYEGFKRVGARNVFVCSMADLFGKWVPDDWIKAVIRQAENNPDWTFLFLTKFPIRMSEFTYPDNTWLGTTVDEQWRVERAETAFSKLKKSGYNGIKWLSCEPLLENLEFTSLDMFDWVVVGGSTKSSKTETFFPPLDWILNLHNQARNADCAIYDKENLYSPIKEYPNL